MAKKKKSKIREYDSLEILINDIVSTYGEGTISQGISGKIVECDAISTGALNLDLAIGVGGVPRGRIIEIYGPYASGKTTLTLEIAANAQKENGVVAFVDVEHALDPTHAEAIGVDMNKILFSQPDSAEQALDIIEILCGSGKVALIILDSVAALVPQAELDSNMGTSHVGLQARLLGQALRKLKGITKQTNTTIIFTNQIREKIGVMFGSPETTSGGKALPYYASVRIDVRRIATLKDSNGEPYANSVRAKVVKNKVGAPFKKAEFDIIFGDGLQRGINKAGCLLDVAVEKNIVIKRGSNYYFSDEKLGNSRSAAYSFLNANSEYMQNIRNLILNKDNILSASDFINEEEVSTT